MVAEVRPADGYAEVNGLRLHYLEWGERGLPDMLLLHGLTSHAHSWDYFARAVCDRYHVVALDQRGHGDSTWPPDGRYRTEDYVADALAVTDTLGLERVVLVGLSMGAHNAMAFTAAHPERVTHLVPVDIAPRLGTGDERRRRLAGAAPPQRVFDSVEEAFRQARAQNPRPPEEVHRHRVQWSLKPLPDGRFELKYDPAAPARWEPADLWEALPRIACPTLVIRGAESQVLPEETARRMVEAFPNARLVTVEGAGHPVPLDRPDAFERAVREFLGA
ncbi:MAG TPA: alpha/beta hydrolase [Dehalococcoidia bacterium]